MSNKKYSEFTTLSATALADTDYIVGYAPSQASVYDQNYRMLVSEAKTLFGGGYIAVEATDTNNITNGSPSRNIDCTVKGASSGITESGGAFTFAEAGDYMISLTAYAIITPSFGNPITDTLFLEFGNISEESISPTSVWLVGEGNVAVAGLIDKTKVYVETFTAGQEVDLVMRFPVGYDSLDITGYDLKLSMTIQKVG